MPDGAEQHSLGDAETFRIGVWTVEPALNQVSRSGETLRLEPKAMALLHYLAERPGEVVSREALLAAVWPKVVVGDDSLTQAIIKLRKALGDTPESPTYIQTVSKRGYRLMAPVVRLDPVAAPASVGEPGVQRVRRKPPYTLVVIVAALACAAAAVWWVVDKRDASTIAVSGSNVEASRAGKPSIRIAPFEALGDDPQAELLARGLTADLATDLSKVFELAVIADTVVAGERSNDAVAKETGYVVTGSVQRIDDRLRLHVRLGDARTGKQLWSERFEGTVASLFALQDELVPKLLRILPAKVSEAELRRVAQHHTRDLEAYKYYQRGQMALIVRQQEENAAAREMFQRAIDLDASFALAYAALAQTYAADHRNQWTKARAAALDRAFELARTAHTINPDVRETYWVLAIVHLDRGEHRQALDYLQTAIRLYPSYADAYAFMGGIYAYLGQPAQTLPLVRTAIRLRPEAGYLYFLILGRAYFGLGDLEQARINLQQAVLRNPVNLEARVYLAATHLAAGNATESRWEVEEIRTLQPDFARNAWFSTHPLRDAKTKAKLDDALEKLGL